MTFLEAIESLEQRVGKLNIKHKDGSAIPNVVAMGRVGRYHGKRYDSVIDDLENAKISVDQYYLEMMKMIVEYGNRERQVYN